MKSLTTLIKLQKTLVDEQQVQLAKLQGRLAVIEGRIAELQISVVREQIAVQKNPESKITYGAFVKATIQQGKILEKERQIAAAAVEVGRAKLAELFEEQKRYEIAEEARKEAERKEERRRETIAMDEVGRVGFTRKKEGR